MTNITMTGNLFSHRGMLQQFSHDDSHLMPRSLYKQKGQSIVYPRFIQASLCIIQGLLKDFPTVFKD